MVRVCCILITLYAFAKQLIGGAPCTYAYIQITMWKCIRNNSRQLKTNKRGLYLCKFITDLLMIYCLHINF